MTGLLYTKHSLDPRDDFMAGWVGRFVEVDNARRDVGFEIALVGCAAAGDGCKMTCPDEY